MIHIPDTGIGTSVNTSLTAKVLAGLYAAGASLAALTVALPHPADANVYGLFAIIVNAYLIAVVLYWRADTWPLGGWPSPWAGAAH